MLSDPLGSGVGIEKEKIIAWGQSSLKIGAFGVSNTKHGGRDDLEVPDIFLVGVDIAAYDPPLPVHHLIF